MSNQENQFDAATEIESALIRNGYSRCRFVNGKYIEMRLVGDKSYYFSTMRDLAFHYKKGDVVFTVGLWDGGHPAQLYNCNIKLQFGQICIPGNCYHKTPMQITDKMLSSVGADNFVKLAESNSVIPFDFMPFVFDKQSGRIGFQHN